MCMILKAMHDPFVLLESQVRVGSEKDVKVKKMQSL